MHIGYFIKNPARILPALLMKYFGFLPDKLYLSILYFLRIGEFLNLKSPRSFNEKLQWLKLYNRRPEYTMMVDKYEVKEYVAKKIGEQYVIPTLGVWNKPEEIPWDGLPNQFVLKTTHGGGGGGVLICRDKSQIDHNEAISKLNKSLKQNIYRQFREWPYKDVKPRIIAEQYIEPHDEVRDLSDYKFFCFNGKVRFFKIDFDRFSNHGANYYDIGGSLLPFEEKACPRNPERKVTMPDNLSKMMELAEILSTGHAFLRIDFYNCNRKIYFGEITFFPAGGFGVINPVDWNIRIGEMLKIE